MICFIRGLSYLGNQGHFLCIGSVCILQQAEHNCIKRCKAQFGLLILDELKKKECRKFWALVQHVCEGREYSVPIFKSTFPACLNETFPNSSLLETLGYCYTRGCGWL